MSRGQRAEESLGGFAISTALFLTPAFHRTVQRGQHSLHFPDSLQEFPRFIRVEDVQRACTLELTVHLVSRGDRVLQIPRELSLTLLSGTFGNVVNNRVYRSKELRPKTRRSSARRTPEGRVVAGHRECEGLVPNFEPPKGLHAENM